MIELSGRVAAAARSPAVRPRRGAGTLSQRAAPAPPTRSHGGRGARRGPDPLPVAGGLRGLPGCRPRLRGGAAAGRGAVGPERPARPLRVQVPEPAHHAHVRLLPALAGTGTAARPRGPRGAAAGRAGGAPGRAPPAPARKLRGPRAPRVPGPPRALLQSGCSDPPFQPPPSPRKEKEGDSMVPPAPFFPGGKAKAVVRRAGSLVSRDFGESRELPGAPGRPAPPARRASWGGAPGCARGPARRARLRWCPRADTLSLLREAPALRPGGRGPRSEPQAGQWGQVVCSGAARMLREGSGGHYVPSPESLRVGSACGGVEKRHCVGDSGRGALGACARGPQWRGPPREPAWGFGGHGTHSGTQPRRGAQLPSPVGTTHLSPVPSSSA